MSCDRSGLLTQQLLPQRLRGRACSRDGSVDTAYPSSSSSSQSWHNSFKRLPSNVQTTEDSSLSSSEGLYPKDIDIGVPPGHTSDQASLFRRRSHRPRGCRGGRKNRKKQLAKSLGVSLPKEVLGAKADSNHLVRVDIYDQAKRPQGFPSGLIDCFEEGTDRFATSTLDENNSLFRRELAAPFKSAFEGDTTTGGVFCGIIYPQQQDQQRTSSKRAQADNSMSYDSGSMEHPMGKTVQDILPPPPAVRKESHEARFEGPNPYALTASRQLTDPPLVAGRMNCANAPSHRPDCLASLGKDDVRAGDVRATVESDDGSGSLFATSPRSFLMGFDGSLVGKGDRSVSGSIE